MKILFLLFLILLSCFGTILSQTAPPETTQAEADKLNLEVVRLYQQKKYDEALPLAQKVIALDEIAFGKNHIVTANAWRNLAFIQLQRENRKEAEKAFKTALEIYERNQTLSPAHEKIFVELLQIVAVNEALDGDFGGAEKKLKQAVAVSEKIYGAEADETIFSLVKLAEFYLAVAEYEKAESPLNRALEMRAKKFGIKDERTKEAYENYSCVLRKLDKPQELTEIKKKYETPVDRSKVKIVESGVVNGKALFLAKPPYPNEAKAQRVSGTVKVRVTIDETGKVIRACAIEGPKLLQRASEIAAFQSKFAPTLLDGNAVKITGVITYNFVAR